MADAFGVLLSRLAEQHKRDVTEAALPAGLAVRSLVEENRRLRQELEALRLRSDAEVVLQRTASWEDAMEQPDAGDLHTTLPGMPAEIAMPDGCASTELVAPLGAAGAEPPTARSSCKLRQATMIALEPAPAPGMEAHQQGLKLGKKGTTPSNCARIKKAVSELDYTHRNKQVRRFRRILDLRPALNENLVVSVEDLHAALAKRRGGCYSVTDVGAIFSQLQAVGDEIELPGARGDPGSSPRSMPFERFAELMLMADLTSHVGPEAVDDVADIQEVFLTDDVEDVVRMIARRQTGVHYSNEEDAATRWWLAALDNLGGATVVVSLLSLSLSLDISPHWPGWVVFEAFFFCAFAVEVGGKRWLLGRTRFWCGPEWKINCLDVIITTAALFDLVISIATFSSEQQSAARITMVLRVLRLSRVARLLKLLQTPLLTSLANLLAGFVIGLPWLLWVVVLLISILFIMGVIFRYTLGPVDATSLLPVCGNGDGVDPDNPVDPDCKAHYLYGEEFFGTVPRSMFTVFRCMIGDCSTRGGQALTVHFSQGFGLRFDVTYFVGMVVVIFGLFNIITSIFVEATLSGLKHNDVQRKHHKLYEARYVEGKLKILLTRIQEILTGGQFTRDSGFSIWSKDRARPQVEIGNFSMNDAHFSKIMQDAVVNEVLDDLDVVQFNRADLFEMFDTNGSGYISVVEFVDTLVKLRGEPQKSDMVAAWVGLRSLHQKFDCFQMLLLENQSMMLNNQDRIAKAVTPLFPSEAQ